ncbi:uncharacterized protein LODBEIA_P00990 [Lodderomyces beijingensis]|uniref:Nucleolar protein 12 n=1 Tax=Lodderomyces beijingensis TaxID=1775926 RepID=A0ABP0ZCF8_9ASCO
MSGFSSLFGDSAAHDQSIDSLFKNAKDGPITNHVKHTPRTIVEIPVKRKRSAEEVEGEREGEVEEEVEEYKKAKRSKRKDENEDLEARYFTAAAQIRNDDDDGEEKGDVESAEKEKEEGSSDENVTETQSATKESKAKSKDDKEKEDRTVFVGNVPSTVVTSKMAAKSFKKLFNTIGKVDTIRYRSIAFSNQLPKRVSFVKKNLHESRDSVNAYVVYVEAKHAVEAAKELNGAVFEDHHLRVDSLSNPRAKDKSRTVFVGNLPFDCEDESLYTHFKELGVESLRIVRDAATNVGKGFALVQFHNSLSVNRALLLDGKPMKLASDEKEGGRKLRISRARNDKFKVGEKLASGKGGLRKKKEVFSRSLHTPIEGQRATKGATIKGIKGLKGGKVKKPRIRDRSTKFKNERNAIKKDAKK